jgi:hypothetical protein
MHHKARFPNAMFHAALRPEGAALAILLTLLFFLFLLLFLTLTAPPAQAQSSALAQNALPPTAREVASPTNFSSIASFFLEGKIPSGQVLGSAGWRKMHRAFSMAPATVESTTRVRSGSSRHN